jgi:transcription elongation GreA/GreB family factor
MSVAFRRESDEEHKEPKFEIPIPVGPNLVTARGHRHIEERVSALQAEIAAGPVDLRLEEAKRDLRYWRTRLSTALLAPSPPADEVAFGSRVVFRLNGATRTLDIVGDDEADPASGSISFSAPLARALIGAAPGDFADFGGEADAIEILEVRAIDEGKKD